MNLRTVSLALGLLFVACTTVLAHPHHAVEPREGLVAGFAHPWLGLDHVLAMFAVGLLAVQLGGRALWLLPACFLGTMILGGTAPMAGLGSTIDGWGIMEPGIAMSLVVLGAALAIGRRYPLAAAASMVGLFGLVHGHAHGAEMPTLAAPLLYACGFVAATALLQAAGIAGGWWLVRRSRWTAAVRYWGAVISCVGLVLFLQAM